MGNLIVEASFNKGKDQLISSLCDACQVLYDNTNQSDEILNIQERSQDGKDLYNTRFLHGRFIKA